MKKTYYIYCTSSKTSPDVPIEIIRGTEAEVKQALKDYLSGGGSYIAVVQKLTEKVLG